MTLGDGPEMLPIWGGLDRKGLLSVTKLVLLTKLDITKSVEVPKFRSDAI